MRSCSIRPLARASCGLSPDGANWASTSRSVAYVSVNTQAAGGAFSVTGTIDIQAHWKGGEIRGYSDRGHGCADTEYHAEFTIYRSKD